MIKTDQTIARFRLFVQKQIERHKQFLTKQQISDLITKPRTEGELQSKILINIWHYKPTQKETTITAYNISLCECEKGQP